QYTAGGPSWGTNVRTNYTKVRLDPATLKVNISDQTFATSSGSLYHTGGELVTSMPYAVAMDCTYDVPTGLANVDLTGTPLAVSNTFILGGYLPQGSTSVSTNNQTVNLTGGGYCGWNAPAPEYNPFNARGGFDLQLYF